MDTKLPQTTLPDFGKKLSDEFEKLKNITQKPNVLIAGGTGAGKSSLINQVFGEDVAVVGTGKPVTQRIDVYESEKSDVRIFDSKGYETVGADDTEFYDTVVNLANRTKNPKDTIHLIWYCISCAGGRVQQFDLDAIDAFRASGIPLAIVLTKADLPSEEEVAAIREALPEGLQESIFETSCVMADFDHTADLVSWSCDMLPDALRMAFTKSQIANLDAKKKQVKTMIAQHCAAAFAAGFVPIPMADAPLLIANEMGLMARILYVYNLAELRDMLKEGAVGSLVSAMLSQGGKALVGAILKVVPEVGTAAGGFISGGVGAAITAAFGAATSMAAYEICKVRAEGGDTNSLMENFGTHVMDLSRTLFADKQVLEEYIHPDVQATEVPQEKSLTTSNDDYIIPEEVE